MTTPEYAAARRAALRGACPWCHMPPGTPCVVASRPSRPLTQLPAHWGRLDAAGAVYELPRGMPADEPTPTAGSASTPPTTSPRQ
jgi:hypothetical protein